MAMYPDLPRPFKRYQIAPVWRADRPQKGRYREFYQCDADTVGTASVLADAEVVTMIYEVLNRLGFADFSVSINNRKLLDGIGEFAGVPEALQPSLYRSIDKLDKIGLEGVRQELLMVGVPQELREPLQRAARLAIQGKLAPEDLRGYLASNQQDGEQGIAAALAEAVAGPLEDLVRDAIARQIPSGQLQAETAQMVNEMAPALRRVYADQAETIPESVVNRLLDLLQITGSTRAVLDDLARQLGGKPSAEVGIRETRELIGYLDALGVPEGAYQLNFAMVRGLEYYTGPIYETTIQKPKAMPSITGGGRFDELIGLFTDVSLPATGTSFGIERIIDAMDELGMFPPSIRGATAEALVTVFNPEMVGASLEAATLLRREGVKTSLYFEPSDRLGDQIGYASAKGIRYVVIVGPDEAASGQVTIRRLGAIAQESEQRTVAREEAAALVRSWM
jgi:histidyl-tRNA synthetase